MNWRQYPRRLAAAVIRRAPLSVVQGLFHEAFHVLHQRGPDYLMLERVPKRAGPSPYRMTTPFGCRNLPRTGIVLQGPLLLDDDFTVETVKFYKATCPDLAVIVSTWVDQPADAVARCAAAGADVVQTTPPAVGGRANVNFQVASARAGLARAAELGLEYVAKSRTDHRLLAVHKLLTFPKLLASFPDRRAADQRDRIIVTSFGSLKFVPCFLTDMFTFGTTADQLGFWDGVPADDLAKSRAEIAAAHAAARDLWGVEEYSAERFLMSSYLRRKGELGDGPLALADWWAVLVRRFLVVDWGTLHIYWPRHTPHAPTARRDVFSPLLRFQHPSFADWVDLYHAPADLGPWATAVAPIPPSGDAPVHPPCPWPAP